MILADKIINLRKKNGWSQEELAELLGVSRQSVSKYESAQSMPDMDKIIRLSNVFGVTTDYLIKDEIELPEPAPVDESLFEPEYVRKVSMEEASEFLHIKVQSEQRVAVGVALCIISPVCLIVLHGLAANTGSAITDKIASGIGVSVLLLLVAYSVSVFIRCGRLTERFEFLETEKIETEYGVSGMVRNVLEQNRDAYVRGLSLGVGCCVCSAIPVVLSGLLAPSGVLYMVGVLLALVALGVYLIIMSSATVTAAKQLLEEGDYTEKEKQLRKKTSTALGIYWPLATAVYLAVSFLENNWDRSWIVWPVAGVLFPVYDGIVKSIAENRQ